MSAGVRTKTLITELKGCLTRHKRIFGDSYALLDRGYCPAEYACPRQWARQSTKTR